MKKSLFLLPLIALFSLTGCELASKTSSSSLPKGGESINLDDEDAQEKIAEIIEQMNADPTNPVDPSEPGEPEELLKNGIKAEGEFKLSDFDFTYNSQQENAPELEARVKVPNLKLNYAVSVSYSEDNGLLAAIELHANGSLSVNYKQSEYSYSYPYYDETAEEWLDATETVPANNINVSLDIDDVNVYAYLIGEAVYFDLSDGSVLNFVLNNIDNVYGAIEGLLAQFMPSGEGEEEAQVMTADELKEQIQAMWTILQIEKCYLPLSVLEEMAGISIDFEELDKVMPQVEYALQNVSNFIPTMVELFKDYLTVKAYSDSSLGLAVDMNIDEIDALIALMTGAGQKESEDGAFTLKDYLEKLNAGFSLLFNNNGLLVDCSLYADAKASDVHPSEGITFNVKGSISESIAITYGSVVRVPSDEELRSYTNLEMIINAVKNLLG